MIKKYKTIRLDAPNARQVFIAGTFNEWNATSLPMQKVRSGEWSVDVPLTTGHYEYKFIVDGQWCCDVGPQGPMECTGGCVPNPFGTMNRVLDVPT